MTTDARLIGGSRGRAIALFSPPSGTTVVARLTSAPGAGGAPAQTAPAPEWPSGRRWWQRGHVVHPRTFNDELLRADGLHHEPWVTSRTVTGLRPVALRASAPKSMKSGAKKKLRVRAIASPRLASRRRADRDLPLRRQSENRAVRAARE